MTLPMIAHAKSTPATFRLLLPMSDWKAVAHSLTQGVHLRIMIERELENAYSRGKEDSAGELTIAHFHPVLDECTQTHELATVVDAVDRLNNIKSFGSGQHWVDLSRKISEMKHRIESA